MSRKVKHKKLAEGRAAILWERYQENGGKITCAEVFVLTAKRASNLYVSFQTHGIKGPPVFDTQAAIKKRHIANLWLKAKELGRNWLTVHEAALALKVLPKEVYSYNRRYGGEIPEIRITKHRPQISYDTSEMVRIDVGNPYTLKYYKSEEGPGPGQMTFYLL